MQAKRLGLLQELVPEAASIGVLANPNYPPAGSQLKGVEAAARTIGIGTVALRASNDTEIETAFDTGVRERIHVLAVASDPFFNTRSEKLVALATRHAVPVVHPFREYVIAGGLISYGVDLGEMYREAGIYAGQIIKSGPLLPTRHRSRCQDGDKRIELNNLDLHQSMGRRSAA